MTPLVRTLVNWLMAALTIVVVLGFLDRYILYYHPAWFIACVVLLVVLHLWKRATDGLK